MDWDKLTLKVTVKGNREARAVFTANTAELLKEHIYYGVNSNHYSVSCPGAYRMCPAGFLSRGDFHVMLTALDEDLPVIYIRKGYLHCP